MLNEGLDVIGRPELLNGVAPPSVFPGNPANRGLFVANPPDGANPADAFEGNPGLG